MGPGNSNPASPVQLKDRIGSLDFLRGIAILGILVINIESFAYPEPWSPYKYGYHSPMDTTTRFWVYFLFQGKFFSMFTLLFGVGFYIFMERLDQKGLGIKALDIYSRRLLWLFVIGVIHAYFIWDGDILYHYAVCGFLLFPFRSFSFSSLIIVLTILITILAYLGLGSSLSNQNQLQAYQEAKEATTPTESEEKAIRLWERKTTPKVADTSKVEIPRQTYWASIRANGKNTRVHRGVVFYQGILFRTLIMMILGMLLYKMGIFRDYRGVQGYWWITISLFLFAIAINHMRYSQWTYEYYKPVTNVLLGILFSFPKELLGLSYILVFNGLYQLLLSRSKWNLVSGLGRMALSQYLFQSIICGLIFYGYGLGLHNSYSRSELLVIVLIIWVLQVILSVILNRYLKQGPVEWIWRKLTYNTF